MCTLNVHKIIHYLDNVYSKCIQLCPLFKIIYVEYIKFKYNIFKLCTLNVQNYVYYLKGHANECP